MLGIICIISKFYYYQAGTKVNVCVENVLRFWRKGDAEKLTQIIFCDISTPSGGKKAGAKFNIYDDIRRKLIAGGMLPEQIAFIHDADSEAKKRDLFAKMRSGQVRVLIGSTQMCGTGVNIQSRLCALHDLDCPWRPRDLTQRKGRIERQGNQNQTVYVCRYVTEDSFDAYLWQTVESKQKFIAQILTSKSPVRSCDDADETALSFAEIQALCAGDPRIKERINLYVEVSRLKLMKADHMSKHFQMEDQIVKYFPEHIAQSEASIRGLETDMQTLAAHPLPEKGFAGIKIQGKYYRSREKAEIALSEALKDMSNLEVNGSESVPLGSYRGLALSVYLDAAQRPVLTLTGEMAYRTEAVPDVKGNLLRIEHELEKLPQRLTAVKNQLDNLRQQQNRMIFQNKLSYQK